MRCERWAILAAIAIVMCACPLALAQQQAPAIGYMYPPGGQAGTTVDVVLGGYDWTPDVEVFVHDPLVQLDRTGTPGPVIVPEPPYWFEKKARRAPFLLPRETPATLTIDPGAKPGVYRWQAANANGATATGRFIVSDHREVRELAERTEPQNLGALPVVVSGQIRKIEEVDQYSLVAPDDGPITLSLTSAAIESPLTATVEVRDTSGRIVVDAADTTWDDLRVTFAARRDETYLLSIYDVDFRGNRSYVYRMTVTPGPQVVAAIPAAGERGETRDVEFVGYGVATGGAQLESIVRPIAFPDDSIDAFVMQLETPFGSCEPMELLLSELPETIKQNGRNDQAMRLSVPSAVTGVLERRFGVDRYVVDGRQGQVWSVELQAEAIGSPLDVALSVLDEQGNELKRSDDLPGTTDAGLEFVVPADGVYQIDVSDSSGRSGNRAAIYRLAVRPAQPGFALSSPEFVNLALGGTTQLAIKATRAGGFADAITIMIDGLPDGVSISDQTVVPAGQNDLKVELAAAASAGTAAAMLQLSAHATVGDQTVTKQLEPILLAITMKPPFSIDAEGKDDVTKWPRGTTFPGPVLVEREEGFAGDIVLEMAARQGRHRQGIRGPELTVAPDVDRCLYPIFLPEWLETTRTSRMVVNGVARVPDPRGRIRYLSSKLKTRIGFLPTGALLKIDCDVPEIEVVAGQSITIPLTVNRAKGLTEDAVIEMVHDRAAENILASDSLTVSEEQLRPMLNLTSLGLPPFVGERRITIRATVMQHGHLPVIAETQVLVVFVSAEEAD